jgi:hypothetical protein
MLRWIISHEFSRVLQKFMLDMVATNGHTIIPQKVNIPALVRNPGSEGIAGIAFSKPVNWLVMTVSPRE